MEKSISIAISKAFSATPGKKSKLQLYKSGK